VYLGFDPTPRPGEGPTPIRQEIKLWDLASKRELLTLPRPAARPDFPNLLPRAPHRHEIGILAISPDGRLLASAEYNIVLWDTRSGEQLRVLAGYRGPIVGLEFSPDGRLLASCGGDGTIRLWDPHAGRELRRIYADPAYAGAIAFSPDGRILAFGGSEKSAKLWDVATGRLLRSLPEQ
jgi:WD40 repeat protein